MSPMKNSLKRSIRSCFSRSIILLLITMVTSSQAISCDWSGEWTINWGKYDGKDHQSTMTLTQTGSSWTGSYDWHGGKIIDAYIVGDKLKGKWIEKDNNGIFEFTMLPDCKFEGDWGYGVNTGDGYWNGHR
jgi:hypothetical protein